MARGERDSNPRKTRSAVSPIAALVSPRSASLRAGPARWRGAPACLGAGTRATPGGFLTVCPGPPGSAALPVHQDGDFRRRARGGREVGARVVDARAVDHRRLGAGGEVVEE